MFAREVSGHNLLSHLHFQWNEEVEPELRLSVGTVKSPATTVTAIIALILKLTLDTTGQINDTKFDAEPKELLLKWTSRCFFVQLASLLLAAQRRARTAGAGREEAAAFSRERGVCRQDTRLYHPCQDDSVYTCFLFFFFFSLPSPWVPFFYSTPPKQNNTNQANEKSHLTKRHTRVHSLFWPIIEELL